MESQQNLVADLMGHPVSLVLVLDLVLISFEDTDKTVFSWAKKDLWVAIQ